MGRRRAKTAGGKPVGEESTVKAAASQRYGHRIALGVILALVLFSRIGTFLTVYHAHPSLILSPDSATYEQPALAILKTGRFASNPSPSAMPEIVRTPGYPLFIAAHYALFGIGYAPVIITQIMLSTAAIAVIYLLCLRLRGPRTALFAAILMAIEPISFLYSQVLLTDALYMVTVSLIAAAGMRFIQTRETELRWAWLLGLSIAVSAHLRPVSYYLIGPVLLGMLAVKRMQARPPRRLLALGAGLLLPWVVLVGGWQLRNAVVAGSAEFSAIQSVNLLLYRAAGVVALRDHLTLEDAQKRVAASIGEQEKRPAAERYRSYRHEAFRIFREHPRLTLQMMAGGVSALLFTSPDYELRSYLGQRIEASLSRQWRELPAGRFYDIWIRNHFHAFLINLLFMWPLSGLLYLGLVFAPWFRRRGAAHEGLTRETLFVHLFLAGLILYLVLVSAGPEANYRFRLAIIPLLAIYSAIGWDKALRGLHGKWSPWI